MIYYDATYPELYYYHVQMVQDEGSIAGYHMVSVTPLDESQMERGDFAGLDAAYQKEYAYAQEMEAEMDAWNAKMGYGDNA